MCQVEEDYNDALEHQNVPCISKKCLKCKELTAAVVIRAGDPYCRDCFKEYFIHKFRAMLGKNRVIFPGEKVLLAVSGGPSSCSMLSQVQQVFAISTILCFDIMNPSCKGGAVGQSVEERRKTVAELQTVFKATGFPFHIVPLEQVLALPSEVITTVPPSSQRTASAYKAAVDKFTNELKFIGESSNSRATEQEEKETLFPDVPESETQLLQQLITSAKTLTARQDLLNTLRQHLLVHTARTEGYSKLMLGDHCTRLAIKLLTSISLGRGAQLAQDTGFADLRFGDVIIVKPMRDYSAKEIAYYNHMFSVPTVFTPNLETKTTEKASIQRLTESFVTKLQADFPSTVSTIYRTSEKLQTVAKGSSTGHQCDRCLLCMCSLDTDVEKASAFKATLISEQLSRTKSPRASSTNIQSPNPGDPHSIITNNNDLC
uniref:Cytoplasmic tRNA 2-thiolation protein 2 n=1 Tax=Takifugu rubripes TaxID=31033 RepID=A0A674N4U1_TAKRU